MIGITSVNECGGVSTCHLKMNKIAPFEIVRPTYFIVVKACHRLIKCVKKHSHDSTNNTHNAKVGIHSIF